MTKPNATSRDVITINVVPEFTGKKPDSKTKRFIDEYVVDFNATQAAVRAGHSKEWSQSHGLKALKKFSDYLAWKQKIQAVENAQKISMSQDDIFSEMELIARANIQDYFTFEKVNVLVDPPKNAKPDAKPKTKKVVVRRWKNPEELTRAQSAAVKRVVLTADGRVSDYVLYDKDSNLFSLGRHLGMFSEKVILEHRHKHLHAKVDLSGMPIDKLVEMEKEFLQYIPEHQREAR